MELCQIRVELFSKSRLCVNNGKGKVNSGNHGFHKANTVKEKKKKQESKINTVKEKKKESKISNVKEKRKKG